MGDRIVLCRRTTNDIGQEIKYCAKPIDRPNPSNWCEECYARLPYWPK